jgi:hypothetical protein
MRKKIVVSGVISLVIGALLFTYGFFAPPWETVIDTTEPIQSGYYNRFWFELRFGMSIHSEYTTSDDVEFLVLDSRNFELFEAGEDFDEIYYFLGKSQTYTFNAPKDDTFNILLLNLGDNDVSCSLKISREASWARSIAFGGIIMSAIGLIELIAGLILKPKMLEAYVGAKPKDKCENCKYYLMPECPRQYEGDSELHREQAPCEKFSAR